MSEAEDNTRKGILKAMRLRHTYGATDNIIADIRCKAADSTEHMMGEEFAVKGSPKLDITLVGAAPFARRGLGERHALGRLGRGRGGLAAAGGEQGH